MQGSRALLIVLAASCTTTPAKDRPGAAGNPVDHAGAMFEFVELVRLTQPGHFASS